MFKLAILSAILAIAAGAPSHSNNFHTEILAKAPLRLPTIETAVIAEPSHLEIREPIITKIGDVVKSAPSSVSHHSSTVVHNREHIVTPIVAPAIKTTVKVVETPVLKTISTPLVARSPSFPFPFLPATAYTGPLRTYGPPALRHIPYNHAPLFI